MKGYQAVAELVRRTGFGTVYSMLGGTIVPWIAEGVDRGSLRLVKTRHEDAAVGGAMGHARSTGAAALCSVTRGPGFTNTITAMVAAVKSHVPILLITGESPNADMPNQNVDQRGLAAVIGAGFHYTADAEELEEVFLGAVRALHRAGLPQVLSIGSAVFDADVALSDDVTPRLRPTDAPGTEDVAAAVDALAAAENPLILAGWGAVFAGCREQILELAEATGAGLATTLRALNLFEGEPANLGLCGGWSPPEVRAELAKADVVLAVGASLNDFTTDHGTVFPRAKIFHCEIGDGRDPALVESAIVAPHAVLKGDARLALGQILEGWRRAGHPPRETPQSVLDRSRVRRAILDVDLHHDPRRGVDPRHVYATLDEVLPDDRIIVTDSGRFLGTIPSIVRSRDATGWLVGNSYSCIGLGLGAAIGASSANPDRTVVLFAGDGGFMMSSHDLDAVRLNDLRLTVVVMNDELYGSDAKYLTRYKLKQDIITQSMPDVVHLAAGFGGTGLVIRDVAELREIDYQAPGLRILDVRIDPTVNVRDVLAAWAAEARREDHTPAAAS